MTISCGRRLRRSGGRPRIRVFRRRVPRIFQHAGLDRASPKICVDRIRFRLRVRDRDAVLCCKGDRVRPRQRLFAKRSAHDEVWIECAHAELDAYLIVAFARAAVRDGIGAERMRGFGEKRGNQRPRQALPRADRRLRRVRSRQRRQRVPLTNRSRASMTTASSRRGQRFLRARPRVRRLLRSPRPHRSRRDRPSLR